MRKKIFKTKIYKSVSVKRKFYTDRSDKWTPLPENKKFKIPKDWENYPIIVIIDDSRKSYQSDFKTFSDPIYKDTRKIIKSLRKDLNNLHFYDEGDINANTHWIGDNNDLDKKHYMSKDIDSHNRLTYLVYPPKLIIDSETGENLIIIPISLVFCAHHRDYKTRKLYSDLG